MKKKVKQYGTNILENIRGLANTRRIELILIDLVIIAMSYFIMVWIASFDISSLKFNGESTGAKFGVLALCIMGVRLLCYIYNSVWRYANVGS